MATAGEYAVGALLAAVMVGAIGATVGDLAYGTVKAAFEGAGLALFVAALLTAPIYVQRIHSRHDA